MSPCIERESSLNHACDSILEGELERLRAIPPYDQFPSDLLLELLAHADICFYQHGKVICQPAVAECSRHVWIVRQGSVRATPPDAELAGSTLEELLEVGALLPVESLLSNESPSRVYAAAEDCFLWRLDDLQIKRLLSERQFLYWLASTLQDMNRKLREILLSQYREMQVSEQALTLPAKSVGADKLVFVDLRTPVGRIAEIMTEQGVGSVIVGSAESAEGIVTQSDILRRVVAKGLSYEASAAEIMSSRPSSIEETATVAEAGIDMTKRHIRHLLVRDATGLVIGVVSERDLFRAQQNGIAWVFKPIDEAQSVAEMALVASRVRDFAGRVFRQGMCVSQFMRMLSSINDRLTQRLLALTMAQHPSDCGFCWLAFGSEGREEQGFATDQDNGIVFRAAAGSDIEHARSSLLALASSMNDALHACGFERCKGNIMAGNPQWCLTLDEWKAKFSAWIHSTTPTAMLNSTIFFDFRPIYGDADLAEELRDHLSDELRGNTIFIAMMARNALTVAPPIGTITRFKTDNDLHKGTIDLKTQGVRLFVDFGRIYALAHSVRTANTEQRIQAVARIVRRAPTTVEGDIAALRFLQGIRLRRQLESMKDGAGTNRIDPYSLNELDQRMLRESLRQAESLQERLRLDYRR